MYSLTSMPNESKAKDKSDAPFKGACYVSLFY